LRKQHLSKLPYLNLAPAYDASTIYRALCGVVILAASLAEFKHVQSAIGQQLTELDLAADAMMQGTQ
jgi:hypothetical protein